MLINCWSTYGWHIQLVDRLRLGFLRFVNQHVEQQLINFTWGEALSDLDSPGENSVWCAHIVLPLLEPNETLLGKFFTIRAILYESVSGGANSPGAGAAPGRKTVRCAHFWFGVRNLYFFQKDWRRKRQGPSNQQICDYEGGGRGGATQVIKCVIESSRVFSK